MPQTKPVAEHLANPLQFDSASDFNALRRLFEEHGYDEPSVCARLQLPSLYHFKAIYEGRDTGTDLNDSLDVLIRLLLDGEAVPPATVQWRLGVSGYDLLDSFGLLAVDPGHPGLVWAPVALYPTQGLCAVSDRTGPPHPDVELAPIREVVYAAITENTGRFMNAMARTPCEDFLDLCSGSGIAALAAGAGFAQRAWSCDITERSARSAEFGRRLNGLDNVTVARGDLYQPVAGRTFDRIVAHPPYIPAKEQKMIFRDGGEDGEQITRAIIEGLPTYLKPGGEFMCVVQATDRQGEPLEQRVRKWLGPDESAFDVFLIASEMRFRPSEMIEAVIKAKGKLGKLGPGAELLEKYNVTALFYGAIVIHRKTADRACVTGRTQRAAAAGRDLTDWFVRWTVESSQPGFALCLLTSRPRLARHMQLRVTHRVEQGRLVPVQYQLRAEYPLNGEANCPNWVAMVAAACTGEKTGQEIYEAMKSEEIIAPEMTPAQFANLLRELTAGGFLEIEAFPLPANRP